MDLLLKLDDGTVETVVEGIEEYNLSMPIAQSEVCHDIAAEIRRAQDRLSN